MLSRLFGPVYSRAPESLVTRAQAADLIEEHFEGITDQWVRQIVSIFNYPDSERARANSANALVRFVAHLRNPDDITTYVHLRHDCAQGMLAKATPATFNTMHIALKEIILGHVRAKLGVSRSERVRNVVVAAIDERRLMVAQFYIESREAALRASEEKYRNSVDHAPDPMYEIEPETWKILGANAAALKLHDEESAVSAEPKRLIGVPVTDFVPPEMRPHMVEGFRKVMREGPQQTTDVPLGPHFFDINEAVISYGDKKFIQMILRDVTQKRELMDTLLKAERLAAAGTFAAGVAHEVNNPLASISSLVQSLLTAEADSERRQTLHTILTQITRISGTLKDLVNFARPATPHRRVIDINTLITETLRLVTYNKRFDGITIEPQLARDLKASFADDNEIQQVLLNVLFNAADATAGRRGAIKVMTANVPQSRSSDGTHRIVIKVIDNGIGIPSENLERVFDPFFTTKASGAGVGLGLSLCQRIILANHGTIRIDSEVGKGTTVAIALPAHEEAARAEGAAAQA